MNALKCRESLIVCAAVLFTVTLGSSTASFAGKPGEVQKTTQPRAKFEITQLKAVKAKPRNKHQKDLNTVLPDSSVKGEQIYIVELKDESLASYASRTTAGFGQKGGAGRLNAKSFLSLSYLHQLEDKHQAFRQKSNALVGRRLEIVYQYKKAFNGMAIRMTEQEARQVAALPGVKSIQHDVERQLHTDVSPDFLRVTEIWNGNATGLNAQGEGIVVGIIDTGINSDHSSFAEVGGDGYVHQNPYGSGIFIGDCVTDIGFCNNKLIGSRTYPDVLAKTGASNGEDLQGHGSHVAGTAAGNILYNVPFLSGGSPSGIVFDRVAGMAPHANIIAYQVCYPSDSGGCPISAITAAIDDAINDSVHVINFSIGGGPQDPWSSADSIAFKNARAAGIFVATSAGNSGPGAGTVGDPAVAPWITSVANSTHNRGFSPKQLIDLTGGDTTPPSDITGRSATGGLVDRPVVFAGDFGDALCGENAFAPGTFSGEIVFCNRGSFALVTKAISVAAGGAAGIIIGNTPGANGALFDISYVVPGIQVGLADANALRTWLSSGAGHRGTITSTRVELNLALADILSSSSSRGPNASVEGVLSPNVAAPGSNIYAAYRDPFNFELLNGTSMASPHVAGAGALLRQLHPGWSAAEIHSALMTTATPVMRKENGVTSADPFDYGGGRIEPFMAARAGLLLDETDTNFTNADPGKGGDPSSLNLPGLQSNQCLQICSWQRTVTATVAASWNASAMNPQGIELEISPESFSLQAGERQTITVTAHDAGATPGAFVFGRVILTPNVGGISSTQLPVAVKPSTGVIPERIDAIASRNAGSILVQGLQSIAIHNLHVEVHGMIKAQPETLALKVDSNNSTPYDNVQDGVVTRLVSVPANASRFVALTRDVDSESPDLDVRVGLDINNDGIPSEDEEVCVSATATAEESCDIGIPEGFPAFQWWVLVQNWQASAPGATDQFILRTAVVTRDDNGNLSAEGPSSQPALQPYDIRVFWNQEMEVGDIFFANLLLGSDFDESGDIGLIPVSVERGPDDVGFSVNAQSASIGDMLNFEFSISPNFTGEDRTYQIAAYVPAGLSITPGSITEGGVQFGNTIFWSVTQESLVGKEGGYSISTSDNDALCRMPFANDGFYLDLAAFGVGVDPVVKGDNENFTAFSGQNPVEFYGSPVGGGLVINTNGFVTLGDVVTGSNNTALPNPAAPNSLIAPFWDDLEVIMDPVARRGVTLASAGPDVTIVEYDDVQRIDNPNARFDFEIFINNTIDNTPGAYEILMAYDNLQGELNSATVGLENADGSKASQYLFNNGTPANLHNDLVVCYDYSGPDTESRIIGFQTTVDNVFAVPVIKKAKYFETHDQPWWWPFALKNSYLAVSGDLDWNANRGQNPGIRFEDLVLYNAVTGEKLAETQAIVLTKPNGKQAGKFVFLLKNIEASKIPCRVRVVTASESVTVETFNGVDNPGSEILSGELTVDIIGADSRDVSGAPQNCSGGGT